MGWLCRRRNMECLWAGSVGVVIWDVYGAGCVGVVIWDVYGLVL